MFKFWQVRNETLDRSSHKNVQWKAATRNPKIHCVSHLSASAKPPSIINIVAVGAGDEGGRYGRPVDREGPTRVARSVRYNSNVYDTSPSVVVCWVVFGWCMDCRADPRPPPRRAEGAVDIGWKCWAVEQGTDQK